MSFDLAGVILTAGHSIVFHPGLYTICRGRYALPVQGNARLPVHGHAPLRRAGSDLPCRRIAPARGPGQPLDRFPVSPSPCARDVPTMYRDVRVSRETWMSGATVPAGKKGVCGFPHTPFGLLRHHGCRILRQRLRHRAWLRPWQCAPACEPCGPLPQPCDARQRPCGTLPCVRPFP
jgi:hypothetical protein